MRIGLTGTMSVGKTTLIKELAKLPEFKDYFVTTERSKYLRDLGIPLNTDSTINGQLIFGAERSSELLHPNLLTDRTIIDVMAFTRLAKSIPHFMVDDFENTMSHLIPQYDYIFYISPEGVEIEDNGVRTTDPKYRLNIDKEIQKITNQYTNKIKKFHTIKGNTEERIQQIKEIIFL